MQSVKPSVPLFIIAVRVPRWHPQSAGVQCRCIAGWCWRRRVVGATLAVARILRRARRPRRAVFLRSFSLSLHASPQTGVAIRLPVGRGDLTPPQTERASPFPTNSHIPFGKTRREWACPFRNSIPMAGTMPATPWSIAPRCDRANRRKLKCDRLLPVATTERYFAPQPQCDNCPNPLGDESKGGGAHASSLASSQG